MNNIPKAEFVLKAIRSYLDGTYPEDETYPFHLELEMELLLENYDEMYNENKEVTLLMNEDIPDVCNSVGEISVDEFKRQLAGEYEKATKVYYRFGASAKGIEEVTPLI